MVFPSHPLLTHPSSRASPPSKTLVFISLKAIHKSLTHRQSATNIVTFNASLQLSVLGTCHLTQDLFHVTFSASPQYQSFHIYSV